MRGVELLAANLAALVVGLAIFFAFRPPHDLPLIASFVVGLGVVRAFQARRPIPGHVPRSILLRFFGLLLNGLYGCFFAVLAYYIILAFSGQIGYPYR
jgi:hypothetical protein